MIFVADGPSDYMSITESIVKMAVRTVLSNMIDCVVAIVQHRNSLSLSYN